MSRIKVTPKQAAEFMAAGYIIECFVFTGTPPAKPRSARKVIPANAKIGLSVQHAGPVKGKMVEVWKKTCDDLWMPDSFVTYPRSKVEAVLKKHGADTSTFAYLANKLECLRVVDD